MTNPNQPCTKPGCPLQGQPHPGCAAHRKRTDPPQPCGRPPRAGVTTCPAHGGHAPAAQAAGAARRAQAAAATELRRLFPTPDDPTLVHVDPTTALLDLISWKHAEVLALRERVAQLDTAGTSRELDDLEPDVDAKASLIWGVTRQKIGGEDEGSTSEARPNVWWSMLRSAEDQLASYAAAAHRAGIADQQIRLAQGQVQLAMDVIRDALGLALASLAVLLGDRADEIRAAWPALQQQVIVQALQTRAARLEQTGDST